MKTKHFVKKETSSVAHRCSICSNVDYSHGEALGKDGAFDLGN